MGWLPRRSASMSYSKRTRKYHAKGINLLYKRYLLLQSVSSAALLSASSAALADEANRIPSGYSVSLEGGYLMGSLQGVDKLGALDLAGSLGTFKGFNSALSVNKKVDELWDIQGNFAFARFMDEKMSYSSVTTSGGSTTTSELSADGGHAFETVDLEFGYYSPAFRDQQLRFFGGLRALQSNKSYDLVGTYTDTGSTLDASFGYATKFQGIGLRAGASVATRFYHSDFGASAQVAGAVIYGQETLSYNFSGLGFSTSGSDTTRKTAYNLDAALGLDWHVNSNSILTTGYKLQEYWNIGEDLSGAGDKTKDLIHGPFIKYVTKF